MSLRARLVAATVATVLSALLVLGLLAYVLVSRSLLRQVDDALQQAHQPVEALASADPEGWNFIPQIAPGLFVAIIGDTGDVLWTGRTDGRDDHSPTIPMTAVRLDNGRQQTIVAGEERMRLRIDRLANGSTLVIGQSLHEVDETTSTLVTVLLIGSGLAVAAVVGLAWLLDGVGLRPLRSVQDSADRITDDDLGSARVPGADQPTEVGRLALALNNMLDRLELAQTERDATLRDLRASEGRMRQFVADASHELRTPVAAVAAYAELFGQGANDNPADLQRAMNGIGAETRRMTRLIDDLLLLARLDTNRPLETKPTDLTEIVLEALETARTLEPERTFTVRVPEVIMVTGDAARLRQMVDNLVANVRNHTPIGASCTVTLEADGDEAALTVADHGPGVPDGVLARLGSRFFRVDDARTRSSGGSGLGLSISRAIVAAHQGTVSFGHHDPTGLVVTVRIPRRPDDDRQTEPAVGR